mmetsp:Transcript_28672/g.58647  ORF Transcript_28672/g.58647 Transcript_28672/m.58647 type:complete len:211 (+) Transcript_28672:180-812(+)
MEARRKLNDANAAFIQKAKDVFDKHDTEGVGVVDAWEMKDALKEMGHDVTDEMIFGMLKTPEKEITSVSFDKFLQMCDASISRDGLGWGKNKTQSDLASAWEAVGGRMDLTGEVDALKLKGLFDLFELETQVDELIGQDVEFIDYVEFCSLLDTKQGFTQDTDHPRRLVTPDMRRPFEDKARDFNSTTAGMETAFQTSLEASRKRTKSTA